MNQAIETRTCLKCNTKHPSSSLVEHDYRCPNCDLETAHLDRAPNGKIRGIFSWLHETGDIISDRYKICSLLGRGGFAATYLVDDMRLDGKPRALKEIPEMLFDTYETNLLSRLNHPSIPDITDQFTQEKMVYLVLKFGGNKTLESVRRDSGGKIPLTALMPWMLQLCDVLDYLHSQNPPVIHRDLKPANILLDDNDRVTLIDFGIAKQEEAGLETRTLARAVTHGFSPPEQIGGTGTDPRSDIYALAATCYAVATGIVPPAGHERLAGKVLVEPIQLISEFSQTLNDALMRALDLNINNRPASITEFASAFDAPDNVVPFSQPTGTVIISDNQPPITAASTLIPSLKLESNNAESTSRSSLRPRASWLLIGGLLCTSLMIVGLGYWYWQKQPGEVKSSDNLEKPQTTKQGLTKAENTILKVSESAAPVVHNTDTSSTALPATSPTEAAPAGSSIPKSSTSALDAFNKRLDQTSKDREKKLSQTPQKTHVSQSRSTPTPTRKKSASYTQKATPKTSNPKQNKTWLNDAKVKWK